MYRLYDIICGTKQMSICGQLGDGRTSPITTTNIVVVIFKQTYGNYAGNTRLVHLCWYYGVCILQRLSKV